MKKYHIIMICGLLLSIAVVTLDIMAFLVDSPSYQSDTWYRIGLAWLGVAAGFYGFYHVDHKKNYTDPKPVTFDDIPMTKVLEDLGFEVTSYKDGYGKAKSLRPNGKRLIFWNEDGHHCDYFGNKLEKNICIGIEEDGGTRKVYNGIVYTPADVKYINELVQ